ncbi:MAG: hypothetical protein RLZZ445_2708 [Pseudomonadota bacterium]|jgi:murein DD-endopeptidase MepM/ murein hydrolase activator NlpD
MSISRFCSARSATICVLLLSVVFESPLAAQSAGVRKGGVEARGAFEGGGSSQISSDGVERRNNVIKATALRPRFPEGSQCEPISSPFGSATRYDGSYRRGDRNSGLHGGMDISLREGTPLLAIAAGEVIASGEGGRLEGFFIWLRHSPDDTDLPFWTYSKYQHLLKQSELQIGARINVGEVIALSGGTGTVGGHYGSSGYPHLHLTTFYSNESVYSVRGVYNSMVFVKQSVMGDPLLLYTSGLKDLDDLRAFSGKEYVDVGIVDLKGAISPSGSKRVWPVSCRKQ